MKFSLPGAADRILFGSIAGAALNGFFGSDDSPVGERIASGAAIGGAAGLFARGIGRTATRLGVPAGKSAGKGLFGHFASMPGNYATYRRTMEKTGAAWHAFGTAPALMLAGAGAGYAYTGDARGAAYGALGGLGVRAIGQGGYWYNSLGAYPFAKTATVMGASTIALAAGLARRSDPQSVTEAATDASGGITDYQTTHVRDRVNSMNAYGDLAFGLHNKRHG